MEFCDEPCTCTLTVIVIVILIFILSLAPGFEAELELISAPCQRWSSLDA